jgi:hypothetical protein
VVSFDLNFLTDEVFPGNSQDINDSDVFGLTTGDVRTGPYLLLSAVAPADGSYTGTAQQLRPADFSDGLIVESNFGVFPDDSRCQPVPRPDRFPQLLVCCSAGRPHVDVLRRRQPHRRRRLGAAHR